MKKYKFIGDYGRYSHEFSIMIKRDTLYAGDYKVREDDVCGVEAFAEDVPKDWEVVEAPTYKELLEMAQTIAQEHIVVVENDKHEDVAFVGIKGIEQIYELFKMYRE